MQGTNEETKINVVVIDNQQLFREGLKRILDFENRFHVAAEGTDGSQAVQLVKEHQPDLVIMDVNMPNVCGIEATRRLLAEYPGTKVLILSSCDSKAEITNALQAGALGYLLKETAVDNLLDAVKIVADGGSYLHPRAAHTVLMEYRRLSFGNADASRKKAQSALKNRTLPVLTRRENEVLQLLAQGKSNRSLGEALYISERTVTNHISSILQKMGVNDRTQAVVTAIKQGWVEVM